MAAELASYFKKTTHAETGETIYHLESSSPDWLDLAVDKLHDNAQRLLRNSILKQVYFVCCDIDALGNEFDPYEFADGRNPGHGEVEKFLDDIYGTGLLEEAEDATSFDAYRRLVDLHEAVYRSAITHIAAVVFEAWRDADEENDEEEEETE